MTEAVLQDLESVLQNQLGDELIVENFSQKLLLPPGENYGSTVLAIEASIKKNKNSKSEIIHLVAKMLPTTTKQREVFDSAFTFRKEIFFYESILPRYKKMEIEFGVKERETFDIGPRYFGSRLSSNEEINIGEDAVILLENLKMRGYYLSDRKFGLDLEHARLAIRALAKFHALGMVVKYKRPDEFEILKHHCKCIDLKPEFFEGMRDVILQSFFSEPEINKYKSQWEPYMEMRTDIWTGIPEEPWSTIIHSDFWVNNIMFHKNSTGQVDDVRFIDFQNYLLQNPLNEVIFFINANVITDLIPKNLDSLLDLYYESFISVLKKMDCDVSLFGKDKFMETVKKIASQEFAHVAFMLKVLTIDVKQDSIDESQLKAMNFEMEANENFLNRMRKIVRLFVERHWI